jgi:N-methylhydantoinase A
LQRHYVQSVYSAAGPASCATLQAAFAELERAAANMFDRAGIAHERRRLEYSVDARYARQSFELVVPIPACPRDETALAEIGDAFHDLHCKTYGHDNRQEPVHVVSVRLAAVGTLPELVIREQPAPSGADAVKSRRQVRFHAAGSVEAAVYDRRRMPAGFQAAGPAVIEALESTILVPPGWEAKMNEDGFVLLSQRRGEEHQ